MLPVLEAATGRCSPTGCWPPWSCCLSRCPTPCLRSSMVWSTLADVFAYAAAEGVRLRIDGTEVQVRRPPVGPAGGRSCLGRNARTLGKPRLSVTGRAGCRGPGRPGRMYDQTALCVHRGNRRTPLDPVRSMPGGRRVTGSWLGDLRGTRLGRVEAVGGRYSVISAGGSPTRILMPRSWGNVKPIGPPGVPRSGGRVLHS